MFFEIQSENRVRAVDSKSKMTVAGYDRMETGNFQLEIPDCLTLIIQTYCYLEERFKLVINGLEIIANGQIINGVDSTKVIRNEGGSIAIHSKSKTLTKCNLKLIIWIQESFNWIID